MPDEFPNNDVPKQRGIRLFRVSLRTFMVLLTAALIVLGWLANQAIRQQQAVAWVEKNGGTVDYAYQYDESDFWDQATPPPGPDWLRNTIGLDYFSAVVQVDLSGAEISDVEMLSRFKELRWLYLYDTNVSSISPLSELTKLDTLYLHNTRVHDFQPIANLTGLTRLDLYNLPISDIEPLTGLENLREIYLYDTKLAPDDVKKLKRLIPDCIVGFREREPDAADE